MGLTTGWKVALGAGAAAAAVFLAPKLFGQKGASTTAAAAGAKTGTGAKTVSAPVTAPGAASDATLKTISSSVNALAQNAPAIITAIGGLFGDSGGSDDDT